MDANVNFEELGNMKIRFCVDRELNKEIYLQKYWEVKN